MLVDNFFGQYLLYVFLAVVLLMTATSITHFIDTNAKGKPFNQDPFAQLL